MSPNMNSTLLLFRDPARSETIDKALRLAGNTVHTENSTLSAMNGQAVELVSKHDVVIFEAGLDDASDLAVIEASVDAKETGIFVALTPEDFSVSKAQMLKSRGVDEVLPDSIDTDYLNKVIENLRTARRGPNQTSNVGLGSGRLMAVVQSTGGSGATTTAVNLAVALAAKKGRFSKTTGAKVAVLDLDVQFGSVGVLMDLEDSGGFLEMIESAAVPDTNYLKGVLQSHSSGVDVLVAPKQMVPVSDIDPNQITTLIDVMRTTYDFTIVDLPRAMVEWLEPVHSRLDDLIMVANTSVPSMRQAKRLIDIYREDNITLQTRVVINGENKPLIKSEQISEGEKLLETKFTTWLPSNTVAARKSADLGRPIVLNKPGSDIAKAYTALSKQYIAKAGQSNVIAA